MDFNYFLKGLKTGGEIHNLFNRESNIKRAYTLAKENRCEEALEILERTNLSSDEKTAANIAGFLIKAVCYAELEYDQSAINCIRTILGMSRFSINPFYHRSLSGAKKMAKEIATEYGYNISNLE